MKSVWNTEHHRELRERVGRLTPQHAPQWGRMTAPQMVVHLTDSLRMASGDLPVAPKKLPLRYPPLKQLMLYYVPIPKGVRTAPELLARQPGEWSADLSELCERLDRFVASGPAGVIPIHPAFGTMTGKQWGVLVYRHMDHHLRQFKV